MPIFYSDKTALDFWRWHASTRSSLDRPVPAGRVNVFGAPNPRSDIVAACEHFRQDGPITVLVPSNRERRHYQDIVCAMCACPLPKDTFWRIAGGVYVSSPEHLFLRYARIASIIELIAIGYTLTANYLVIQGDLIKLDEPLTSLEKLASYIRHATGTKGVKKARRALNYIAEGSASPRETELAMLLSLPRRLGGYNLPKPVLNQPIYPSSGATRAGRRDALGALARAPIPPDAHADFDALSASGDTADRFLGTLRPDLSWPSAKVAVEYESDAWHGGQEKFVADSKRRNRLRSMGYDAITVTNAEFSDIEAIERIADDLRAKLGLKCGRVLADFPERHYQLRKLFKGMERWSERTGLSDFWA